MLQTDGQTLTVAIPRFAPHRH